jgi:uncharacterized protein (UPF0335 family)
MNEPTLTPQRREEWDAYVAKMREIYKEWPWVGYNPKMILAVNAELERLTEENAELKAEIRERISDYSTSVREMGVANDTLRAQLQTVAEGWISDRRIDSSMPQTESHEMLQAKVSAGLDLLPKILVLALYREGKGK